MLLRTTLACSPPQATHLMHNLCSCKASRRACICLAHFITSCQDSDCINQESSILGDLKILPCSNLQLAATVAESIRWSEPVASLAAEVLQGMAGDGASLYNAVHFRIERDAKDWAQIMGGIDVSMQPLTSLRDIRYAYHDVVLLQGVCKTDGWQHSMAVSMEGSFFDAK